MLRLPSDPRLRIALLVALPLVAVLALVLHSGGWKSWSEVDDFSDEVRHFVARGAKDWEGGPHDPPKLGLACREREGSIVVFVNWHDIKLMAVGINTKVEYRFDGEEAVVADAVFTGHGRSYLILTNSKVFLGEMLTHKSLRIRAFTRSIGAITAEFNLSGLRSRLGQFEKHCGV